MKINVFHSFRVYHFSSFPVRFSKQSPQIKYLFQDHLFMFTCFVSQNTRQDKRNITTNYRLSTSHKKINYHGQIHFLSFGFLTFRMFLIVICFTYFSFFALKILYYQKILKKVKNILFPNTLCVIPIFRTFKYILSIYLPIFKSFQTYKIDVLFIYYCKI